MPPPEVATPTSLSERMKSSFVETVMQSPELIALIPKPTALPAGVRVADIIEKTAQPFAGCLGHVIVVEQDSVVCVQQPSQASSLTWFRVQNSNFRIVGRAIGRYKIPPDEIQRRIDALKPVKVNLDNFDEPAVAG